MATMSRGEKGSKDARAGPYDVRHAQKDNSRNVLGSRCCEPHIIEWPEERPQVVTDSKAATLLGETQEAKQQHKLSDDKSSAAERTFMQPRNCQSPSFLISSTPL